MLILLLKFSDTKWIFLDPKRSSKIMKKSLQINQESLRILIDLLKSQQTSRNYSHMKRI